MPEMSLLTAERLDCLHLCGTFKSARVFSSPAFRPQAETRQGSKGIKQSACPQEAYVKTCS